MIQVEIHIQQDAYQVDRRQLRLAIQDVLSQEGIRNADISLAVVDDMTIQSLNRRYLRHDYPTDVLSFAFNRSPNGDLEGEIIVSMETATHQSVEANWPVENELLLYVIHGALHLARYDDQQEKPRAVMKAKEQYYLKRHARLPLVTTSLDESRRSIRQPPRGKA